MTSIKEALERIKRTALDAKPEDVPKALAHIVRLCIDADRTTVESGDARERIARIIHPVGFEENSMERVEVVAAYQKEALAKADAILATGLVPDEAAVRGGWHTTGWDRARNSGRILLVWREFAGVREHVELGRYSDSKTAWVNTYGHPFHAEPDGWAPLLPFKTAEAIRADEREKCAQEAFTAVTHVVIPDDGNTTLADHVAAAIRAGGAK